MGVNISEFRKEIEKKKEYLRDITAKGIKEIMIAGYESSLKAPVDGGAPKDTGWLRSNIYISLNVPIEDTYGSKKNVMTSRRDRLFNAFKNEAPERIIYAKSFHITYTVPYVSAVNDGSAHQIGQHFIEKAIQEINSELRKQRRIS